MPGEEILTQSNDKTITLTNFRIRYYESKFGNAGLVSIHLPKVSSIEMKYKSNLSFLYLGGFLIAAGIFIGLTNSYGGEEPMLLGTGVGAFLVLIYWLTRRHVVSISSDGGAKINFQTKGMKNEDHVNFINKIEAAKHSLNSKHN